MRYVDEQRRPIIVLIALIALQTQEVVCVDPLLIGTKHENGTAISTHQHHVHIHAMFMWLKQVRFELTQYTDKLSSTQHF